MLSIKFALQLFAFVASSPMPATSTSAAVGSIAIMQCKAPNSDFQDRTELWVSKTSSTTPDRKTSIVAYHPEGATDSPLIDLSVDSTTFPSMIFFNTVGGGLVKSIPEGAVTIERAVFKVKTSNAGTVTGPLHLVTGSTVYPGEAISVNNVVQTFQCQEKMAVLNVALSLKDFD